jgi:hypothetical protein
LRCRLLCLSIDMERPKRVFNQLDNIANNRPPKRQYNPSNSSSSSSRIEVVIGFGRTHVLVLARLRRPIKRLRRRCYGCGDGTINSQ